MKTKKRIRTRCRCSDLECPLILLHIDADLSHTHSPYWTPKQIDKCVAPFVSAFQGAGINMRASCCGHKLGPMRIDLSDGRIVKIYGRAK